MYPTKPTEAAERYSQSYSHRYIVKRRSQDGTNAYSDGHGGTDATDWLFCRFLIIRISLHGTILVDQLGPPVWSRRCKSSFTAGVGANFNASSR